MSIQAVAWVLDHSKAGGSERLVMISLANHADPDGIAGPSMTTIASESRLSRDTVRRCLRDLAGGEIDEVDEVSAPPWWTALPGNRRPKLWRLAGVAPANPKDQAGVAPANPHKEQNAAPVPSRGGTGVAQGSRSSATQTNNREPKKEKAGADAPSPESGEEPANAIAKRVGDAFFAWVKKRSGHHPPEKWQAVRAIVVDALGSGFSERQIKTGLRRIEEKRPRRPITRQTLWEAMAERSTQAAADDDPIARMHAVNAQRDAEIAAYRQAQDGAAAGSDA